jgi:hypothetical protein
MTGEALSITVAEDLLFVVGVDFRVPVFTSYAS